MYGLINTGLQDLLDIQKRQRRTKRVRLSRRFRQRIFFRDNGHCVYCGNPVRFLEATIDHVQPLTKLGKNRAKENCALSCRKCNNEKGPLVMDDLGDLSPEALCAKFHRACESVQTRKGLYSKK